GRMSAHDRTFLEQSRGSADPDLGVGKEGVRGQRQVLRRGPLTDAAGAVVLRAVARAEPAVVIAFVRQRDAAEMRADADDDEPLLVAGLHALRVRLRIGQRGYRHVLGEVDVLRRAVEDEDRLRAPEDLDDLPLGDRREVDLDRGAGGDRRSVRIHLVDERHQGRSRANCRDRAGRDVQEVASRVLRRRHGRHVLSLSPGWLMSSARGEKPREYSLGGGGGAGCGSPSRKGRDGASAGVYWHPCGASASPLSGETRRAAQVIGGHALRCTREGRFHDRTSSVRITLYEPDIPQNAGTILRLCACLGIEAHIVEPAGFPVTDRAFRRAGMDYLDQVTIVRHASFAAFDAWRREQSLRLVLLTTAAERSYLDHAFTPQDIVLLGRE